MLGCLEYGWGKTDFVVYFIHFFFVDSNNWLGWVEMMGPKLVTVYVDGLKLMFMLGNIAHSKVFIFLVGCWDVGGWYVSDVALGLIIWYVSSLSDSLSHFFSKSWDKWIHWAHGKASGDDQLVPWCLISRIGSSESTRCALRNHWVYWIPQFLSILVTILIGMVIVHQFLLQYPSVPYLWQDWWLWWFYRPCLWIRPGWSTGR